MKITAKVLKGGEASLEFENDSVLVEDLKKAIAEKLSIPVESQSLVYKGRALSDLKPLSDYSITEGSKVVVCRKSTPSSASAVTPPSLSTTTTTTTTPSTSATGGGPSAAEPVQPADEPYKDWSGLYVKFEIVFAEHFSPEDTEKICQYFREELRRCVYSTNLDQIEFIAKQSLQIHENRQYELRDNYYKKYESTSETQQPS